MVETAENVARERRITTEEQHEVTLRRYAQYKDALAQLQMLFARESGQPAESQPEPEKPESKLWTPPGT